MSVLGADLEAYRELCYPASGRLKGLLRTLIAHPASLAVIWFRFGQAVARCPQPIRVLGQLVYWPGFLVVRALTGVQLLPACQVGPGLVLLHYGTTVIHPGAVIGRNCTFYHNITLAADRDGSSPVIGDEVMLGVGVVVFGSACVGSGSMVGAGAVVTRDVPVLTIAGGVPAKALRAVQREAS